MSGNVWQWASDWYRPDYYARLEKGRVAINPQGPEDSFDPQEPGIRMPGTRGKGDFETVTNHVGFRCVRSQ